MTVKPLSCHSALTPALPYTHISPVTQAAGSSGHCQSSEGFCRGLGESWCALEVSVPKKRTLELRSAEVETLDR